MFKSALFRRKKTAGAAASRERSFGHFYNEWLGNLSTSLLPQLRRVLPSLSSSPALVSAQVEAIHQHFISYYEALDEAATADVAQCLYPEWRNSLEKPFLWLGDLHPYLFTNLLRSFLDNDNINDQESSQEDENKHNEEEDDDAYDDLAPKSLKKFLEGSWRMDYPKAWKSPSKALTRRLDQIECGLRLMVPALTIRVQKVQGKLARSVATEWGDKKASKSLVEEGLRAELEELVGVVVDANRMRRSVLADVLSVTSLYQGASFLEALAQFLIGFRDEKLVREFHLCNKTIN